MTTKTDDRYVAPHAFTAAGLLQHIRDNHPARGLLAAAERSAPNRFALLGIHTVMHAHPEDIKQDPLHTHRDA